jgi:NAD(P)-dependent dehydrogenase (short-subunit alcohol dehydrogenase family)
MTERQSERAVVITGASTGIGKATALTLDAYGYRVFAGVRKEEDSVALKAEASEALTPLLLDVTDGDAVAGAVARVGEEAGGKLFGLVNNAGLSLNGPLEIIPDFEIRRLFDVNVLGLLSVTRSFIPLLRRAQGRLVNVSSGHGLLAIPDKSVYAASKYAVQAISDSLRLELRPFGVSVSNLVVGKVDTAVLGKILEERKRLAEAADPAVLELYSPLFEFFDREVKDLQGIPPEEVAKVAAEALTVRRPKAQYLVGPGARKMRNLSRLPRGLREGLMYKALYGAKKS